MNLFSFIKDIDYLDISDQQKTEAIITSFYEVRIASILFEPVYMNAWLWRMPAQVNR